jgi:chromosome segregation ATPase
MKKLTVLFLAATLVLGCEKMNRPAERGTDATALSMQNNGEENDNKEEILQTNSKTIKPTTPEKPQTWITRTISEHKTAAFVAAIAVTATVAAAVIAGVRLHNKNNDLTGRVTKLLQENEQLKNDNKQTANLAVDLTNTNADLNTQIANSANTNANLNTQINNLANDNAIFYIQAANLANDNANLNTQVTDLADTNANLNAQVTDLADTNANLNTQINNLANDNAIFNIQVTNLANDNASLNMQVTNLMLEKENDSAIKEQLKNDITSLKDKVNEKTKVSDQLQKELTISQANHKSISDMNASLKTQLSETNQEKQTLELENLNLKSQAGVLQKAKENLNNRLTDEENNKQNLKKQIESLQNENSRLKLVSNDSAAPADIKEPAEKNEQLDSVMKQLNQANEKVKKLEDQLKDSSVAIENAVLKKQIEELVKQGAEQSAKLEKKLEEVNEEVNKKHEELEEKNTALEKFDKKNNKLLRQLDALEKEKTRLEKLVLAPSIFSSTGNDQSQNTFLQNQINYLRQQNDYLQEDNAGLKKQSVNLYARINQLNIEKNKAAEDIGNLNIVINQLKSANSKLTVDKNEIATDSNMYRNQWFTAKQMNECLTRTNEELNGKISANPNIDQVAALAQQNKQLEQQLAEANTEKTKLIDLQNKFNKSQEEKKQLLANTKEYKKQIEELLGKLQQNERATEALEIEKNKLAETIGSSQNLQAISKLNQDNEALKAEIKEINKQLKSEISNYNYVVKAQDKYKTEEKKAKQNIDSLRGELTKAQEKIKFLENEQTAFRLQLLNASNSNTPGDSRTNQMNRADKPSEIPHINTSEKPSGGSAEKEQTEIAVNPFGFGINTLINKADLLTTTANWQNPFVSTKK